METKPYLIALDLDGTLLKDDKTISENTLHTIQRLKDDGHYVCISTGRPYRFKFHVLPADGADNANCQF